MATDRHCTLFSVSSRALAWRSPRKSTQYIFRTLLQGIAAVAMLPRNDSRKNEVCRAYARKDNKKARGENSRFYGGGKKRRF